MLSLLLASVLAPIGWTPSPATGAEQPSHANAFIATCRATDGDTIRCGSERIRLLGIDAPELPGHCRPGRHCAPGDPWASRSSLSLALRWGSLRILRVGIDRYGRTLAMVSAAGRDLSCWQLQQRQAVYRPQWDDGARVSAICKSAVD